jgi:hypothetical protein
MFVFLLLLHWVSDFVLQRHAWSIAKWNSIPALLKHVATVTVALFLGTFLLLNVAFLPALAFAGINGGSHFGIDFVTSKMTHKLYDKGKLHDFFVVIGFDQFLHVSIMYGTFLLLF